MGRIFGFILPVVLLLIGIQFVRDYFGQTEQQKRKNLEQLVAGGQETDGTFTGEFEDKTIKVAKVPIPGFDVEYSFAVGDKTYTGRKRMKELPNYKDVKVSYLPADPNINAADPSAELAKLNDYENDNLTLFIGLGLMLAGLGLGFFRFRAFQRSRMKSI